jgi:hypothetical protein
MLSLYRYMVDNGMKKLSEVPEPYQRMLREEGYTEEPAPTE